ncbi:MAG: aldehyde dehydrogenase family protein [Alphaproteobacteria bacterium]|nr:MAG: aldehyde dehydrogenase family protein [Alphaproteobacteria bacterium]
MANDEPEKLLTHYVGGAWVAPLEPRHHTIVNPTDGTPAGTLVLGGPKDVDRAVAAAVAAWPAFAGWSRSERLDLLRGIRDETARRLGDLAAAISADIGAPMTMARTMQADAGVGHMDGFIAALERQPERETIPGDDVLVREPVGPAALITPWNWPVNQIVLKVGAALAAGCTAVLKPSEFAPRTSVLYMDILAAAGVPPGVVNMIQGDGETGAALSRHPQIAMISFTGSTRAGRDIMCAAAEGIRRVALELGGKSPNLVFADCGDALEARVRSSVAECFLNTGQSCDAPTRMLVERAIYEQVVEIAADAARNTRLGNPAEEGDHLGPIVNERQFRRVRDLIETGIEEGARLVAGGPEMPKGFNHGFWVRPTVFADVTPSMTLWREEVFGPVLAITPFETEADAIALGNDTVYGLAAYVQTGDPARAERVALALRAGAVHVNGQSMEYGTPFGGYRQSGIGREGGIWGIEEFQEIKTIHAP